MKDGRHNLEKSILASCLFSPANALLAGDIIKPANFADEFHSRLFQVIISMLSQPFDMVLISIRYEQAYGESKHYAIAQIAEYLVYTNIQVHALLLLEYDIREKFVQQLSIKERLFAKKQEFEKAAICKESKEHLENPENEIFEAIDSIFRYLSEYIPDDLEPLDQYVEAIPEMVHRIRKKNRLSQIISLLQELGAVQPTYDQQKAMNVLIQAMITILTKKELPEQVRQIVSHFMNSEIYE